MSSGSRLDESAVEPTRSQNITVSWRRSASGGHGRTALPLDSSPGSGWRRRAGITALLSTQGGHRLQHFQAGAERQSELLEVLVGEFRQDRGVDLVVAEHRLIALQAETPEPSRDVHLAPPFRRSSTTSRRGFTMSPGSRPMPNKGSSPLGRGSRRRRGEPSPTLVDQMSGSLTQVMSAASRGECDPE